MPGKHKSDHDSKGQPAAKKQKTVESEDSEDTTQDATSTTAEGGTSNTASTQLPTSKATKKRPTPLNLQPTEDIAGYLVPRISGGIAPFPELPPVQMSFWNTIRNYEQPESPRKKPKGLSNPKNHNKCYQNAVITALLGSKRFVAYIRGWHMDQEYDPRFKWDQVHVLAALDQLVQSLHNNKCTTEHVELAMQGFRDLIVFPSQKDADQMPGSCWVVTNHVAMSATDCDEGATHVQCDAVEFLQWILEMIAAQLAASTSPKSHFDHLVRLRCTERVCCSLCDWPIKVRKDQPITSLYLELNFPGSSNTKSKEYKSLQRGETRPSMADCMSYSLIESRDGNFKCTRCGRKGNDKIVALKRLQTAPEILIMSFVRYSWSQKGGEAKLLAQVPIEEQINIGPWLEPHSFGEGSSVKYNLVAIVSHVGRGLKAGHYISYVRGSTGWYRINDSQVKKFKFSELNDSELKAKATGFVHGTPWEDRDTPYIMIYEKDYSSKVIQPGRFPMNPSTVESPPPADEKPAYWIEQLAASQMPPNPAALADATAAEGLDKPAADGMVAPTGPTEDDSDDSLHSLFSGPIPSPEGQHMPNEQDENLVNPTSQIQDAQNTTNEMATQTEEESAAGKNQACTIPGPSEDHGAGPAELGVYITIGNFKMKLPSIVISQFNKDTERDITIDAFIKAPKDASGTDGNTTWGQMVTLNIMELMSDTASGNKVPWESRWRPRAKRWVTPRKRYHRDAKAKAYKN